MEELFACSAFQPWQRPRLRMHDGVADQAFFCPIKFSLCIGSPKRYCVHQRAVAIAQESTDGQKPFAKSRLADADLRTARNVRMS